MSMDYGDVSEVAKATRKKVKAWRLAYVAMRKASFARSELGPHATRARLTTANARYARAAEDFDRRDAELREWAQTVDPVNVDDLKEREDHALMCGFRARTTPANPRRAA